MGVSSVDAQAGWHDRHRMPTDVSPRCAVCRALDASQQELLEWRCNIPVVLTVRGPWRR